MADRAWVQAGGSGISKGLGIVFVRVTVGHIDHPTNSDEPIDLPNIVGIVPVRITTSLDNAASASVTVRCRRRIRTFR